MLDFLFPKKPVPSEPRRPAADELALHPSSYADPNGQVFTAGTRIYRGLRAQGADFARRLLSDGQVEALVAKGLLIPTEISSRTVDGFPLVLEHERVPFVSYPYEWPAEMLRAAALHTLDLLIELEARGLALQDAHGWNVLFRGTRPVFVDFGSIVPLQPGEPWRAEQEFREYFLHPLALMAAGQGRVARAMLHDFERGIRAEDFPAVLTGLGEPPDSDRRRRYEWYRDRIVAIDFSAHSAWSAYYDGEFPGLDPAADWTPKHRAVHEILGKLQPRTVLDIGANRGWYSLVAAHGGAQAVAFDNDEVCVNQLFRDARERGRDVQPLVMSFVNPSPRLGLGEGFMTPAVERFSSDLVLGLALVHHLVFKMHLNFEQIAAALAGYARRTLVVEMPPADDIHVRHWMSARYAWYTPENFQRALSRHFRKIERVDSHPLPRFIFVCER